MKASGKTTVAGRIGSAIFGLFFAAFGLIFIGIFVFGIRSETAKNSWPETSCVIESAAVDANDDFKGGFKAVIQFVTRIDGRVVQGTHTERTQSYAEASSFAARFPQGSTATGRYDPANPSEITLSSSKSATAKWVALPFMLIPLVFVAVGLGIFWTSIRKSSPAVQSPPVSLSSRNTVAQGRNVAKGVGGLIAVVFTGIGLVGTWSLLVSPALKVIEAKSWVPTPCVIEASRVVSSRGSKSTTYRPEILYRYQVSGTVHRSSQIRFFTASSSGYQGKADFVAQYPVGASATCFVDPKNPANAVLLRDFSAGMLIGLLPLVFLTIGLAILAGMLGRNSKGRGAAPELRATETPSALRAPITADGAALLKPAASPLVKLVAVGFISVFWNGIVSVFLWQFFQGLKRGRPEWFLGVFMIPFVLVGLGLVAWFVYQLLALANPRPRLRLKPSVPRAGDALELSLEFDGAVHRMSRLTVDLIGREAATYRRGTSTSTDHSVFARIPLLETGDPAAMRSADIATHLPAESVPSFAAPNNKIAWSVRVRGDIARWPDVSEEFPVEVSALPSALSAAPVGEAEPPTMQEAEGLRLGLKGGRRNHAPGDTLEGVAAWSLPTAPRQAEVRLFWFTEGKGTSDVSVVATETFAHPVALQVEPFRFILPDQPPSVDGRLISIRWAVELVLKAPKEKVLRQEFVVSPIGQAYHLQQVPDEGRSIPGKIRHARGG